MNFLSKQELNLERYDALIASDAKNNVFCYSWYLSATTENWGAIVDDEYTFAIPIPFKNRIFFKQFFQHPYSRNIDFFGDSKLLPEAIKILQSFYKFRFHFPGELPFSKKERVFQSLDLNKDVVYKKNAQRILKKNEFKYKYIFTENYESILSFYFQNSFNKIKQQNKNKKYLNQLLKAATKHKKGQCLEVWENETCVAAAFFLFDKKTICYLIGDANEINKKEGVMFSLMNYAIMHYKTVFETFDFGGSNIESVATFYRKMGGKDSIYYEYIK